MKLKSTLLLSGALVNATNSPAAPDSPNRLDCENCTVDVNNDYLRPRASGWTVERQSINSPWNIHSDAHLSAVSHDSYSVDLFFLADGPDNDAPPYYASVPYHFSWNEGRDWTQGSMGLDNEHPSRYLDRKALTALSTGIGQLEVFYMSQVYYSAQLNYISSRYWGNGQWNTPSGQKARMASKTTRIAATSRYAGQMELFYAGQTHLVDPPGILHSYYKDSEWHLDQLVPGSDLTGTVIPSSISAVSMDKDHTQVFWINISGELITAKWTSQDGWTPATKLYPPVRLLTQYATINSIAAISRKPGKITIFFFDEARRNPWQGYLDSAGKWVFSKLSDYSTNAGAIAATSMRADHQEIFWVSGTGTIHHAYWTEAKGWNSEPLPNSNGVCTGTSQITAASRKGKNTIEGWCTTDYGRATLTHFYYYQ